MLDRLVGRSSPIDLAHKAEAVSLVLWNPNTATINIEWPEANSPLRIERFSEQIQEQYYKRYDGMAPHDQASPAQKKKLEQLGEEIPEPAEIEEDRSTDN